jgi:hypothetical protein
MHSTSNQSPAVQNQNQPRNDGVGLARDVDSSQLPHQVQDQPISYSGGGKEAEPLASSGETIPLVEVAHSPEIAPEVESWMEKVEKAQDVQLAQPVMQDDAVVVAHPSSQVVSDQVILPLTLDQIESAQKHSVGESVRWLAEWCIRLTKVLHAKEAHQEVEGAKS